MNNPTTAVATKRDEKALEYIPFGSEDKIRLTIAIVRDTICTPTKSGVLPDDRYIIKFMMLCQAQRLNPFAGDAYLVGYDGKNGPQFSMICALQSLLKRAEVSDHFEGMQSGIIVADSEGNLKEIEGDFYDKEQEVVGGWAKVFHGKRKGYPFYKRLRIEAFQSENKFWDKDAAGMICKCAEADALRSAFPTMLGGLYIAEEQTIPVDIQATVSDVIGATRKPRPLAAPTPELSEGTAGAKPRTPQQDLESGVIERGGTFDKFQKWGEESGNVPGASAMASFEDVPKDIAARLLKNLDGLIDGMGRIAQ